jgi:8-amino-7-oxononanoate synthase
LQLGESSTPIQPWIVGDTEQAVALSARLREEWVLISAIRPPTVPQGTARLRITFSAAHDEDDVDRLLSIIEAVH